MNKWLWLAAVIGVSLQQVGAQTLRRLTVQSQADRYELVISGATAAIGGKTVDLNAIHDQLPLLTNPLTADCPKLTGSPEVTVKESGHTRSIYLKQGLVSDGTKCLTVSGDGLLFFPIHRDFLIGTKQDSIPIRSSIKIFRQGVKLFDLKKVGDTWNAEGTTMLLDWDFLERFQNSLKSFDIRFRAQPDLAKGKPKMIVQVDDQSYEFYKISTVAWALKKPGNKWLETSDDWSFWYSFDNSLLEDRFTSQIRFLSDPNKDKAARLAALEKLDGSYTRNLRDLYHRFVLNKDEDQQVKEIAFKRLRAKPGKETALVMAEYLQHGDVENFKKLASQILKINNPKGPLYNPLAPESERHRAVAFWAQWQTQNQPTP